jgi:hypothetical protein
MVKPRLLWQGKFYLCHQNLLSILYAMIQTWHSLWYCHYNEQIHNKAILEGMLVASFNNDHSIDMQLCDCDEGDLQRIAELQQRIAQHHPLACTKGELYLQREYNSALTTLQFTSQVCASLKVMLA